MDLDQDAAHLAALQQEIVRPLQPDAIPAGAGRRHAGGQAEERRRLQDYRSQQRRPLGGFPAAIAPAAAGRLVLGDHDGAHR